MTRERFQIGPSLCPFALENTQNSVGFSLKVTFQERFSGNPYQPRQISARQMEVKSFL